MYEANGLRVTAFAVDHDPVHPAVGYRFEYGGRSLVVSGDTAKSANLEAQAQGVDLLVHEALAPQLVKRLHDAAEAAGRANVAKITNDILDYHADASRGGRERARCRREAPALLPRDSAAAAAGARSRLPRGRLGRLRRRRHTRARRHADLAAEGQQAVEVSQR